MACFRFHHTFSKEERPESTRAMPQKARHSNEPIIFLHLGNEENVQHNKDVITM
jgi:hypothetical protein